MPESSTKTQQQSGVLSSFVERNRQVLYLFLAALASSLALASISWFRVYLYHIFELPGYLAIQSALEFASVVISFAVATIGWYSYRQTNNKQTLVIGFTFFTIGLFDFAHALSLPGMPYFLTPSHTERAFDFWMAARVFGSFSLLVAAFVRPDSNKAWINPPLLATASLLTFGAVLAVIISFQEQLPYTFIPGRGATTLKTALEYVVVTFYLAAVLVYGRRRTLDKQAVFLLQVALIISVFSELSFTSYRNEYDTYNLLGHIFKIVAFYFIMQALYVAPLLKPYQELLAAKDDLEKAAEDYQLLYRQAERQSKILEESFLRMGQALATGHKLQETLERIVRLAADTYYGHAVLLLYDPKSDSVTPVHYSGLAVEPVQIPMKGTLAELLRNTGNPAYFNSPSAAIQSMQDFYLYGRVREAEMQSILGAPISRGERFLGVILVQSTMLDAFSSRDAELLHSFAQQAAIAIDNAHLFEENLRTTSFIRSVLANVPAAIAVVSVPEFKFLEANPLYREIPDIKNDIIGMYIRDVFSGWEESNLPQIFNQVVETKRPATFYEYMFTLLRRGNTYWNFTLSPNLHPETGEVESITILAIDVTEEIALRKGIEEANRELRVLNSMSEEIIREMELDKRLTSICKHATELVGSRGCVIAFFNEERQEITFPILYNLPETIKKLAVPLGQSLANTVVKTRKPVLIQDYAQEPQAIKEFVEAGVRGVAGVPLVFEDKPLGALEVFAIDSEHVFAPEDIELLENIAGQAAIAIVNARLFEEQSRIAEILQKSLLPQELSTSPETEVGLAYSSATPGALVGGDFYDVFDLAGNNIGLVIGDVAGRGIEAAAYTSLVKSGLRVFSSEHSSPASVVSRTNRAIFKEEGTPFITVFYGRLNLESGELHYSNAGHPPPVVIFSGSDNPVASLHYGQTPLGIEEGTQYSEFLKQMNPGDKLVLYTDGLLEARRDGELFGQERLLALAEKHISLSAEELAEAIRKEVTDFAQGKLRDDFAVMVVTFKKK